MLKDGELRILACFFPKLEEKTLKELKRESHYSHERVFTVAENLVKAKYLKKRKVGKTNVYQFVFTDDSFLVYTYFTTKKVNEFKKKHSLLYKRLKEFSATAKARAVVLFGSYAKGTETRTSDIDILCVSNEKNIESLASSFKTKYGINIRPIIIKPENFKNIKRDNPPFYADLVEFGLMINSMEFFFEEVYGDEKA